MIETEAVPAPPPGMGGLDASIAAEINTVRVSYVS